MFWKTSCNTNCFSLLGCCLHCLRQFPSVQSQKVMWSSGLYGHWVRIVKSELQDRLFRLQNLSPSAQHYQCPVGHAPSSSHTVPREPPKGVEAFIAALKLGLTTKEQLLLSSLPNMNMGLQISAFFVSLGWTLRPITSLPLLKDWVL